MISRQQIANATDSANEIFQERWTTLVALKERRLDDEARTALLRFQYRLASALFALDDIYRVVCAESDATIQRKASLRPPHFRDRMQRLSRLARHAPHSRDSCSRAGGRMEGAIFAPCFVPDRCNENVV